MFLHSKKEVCPIGLTQLIKADTEKHSAQRKIMAPIIFLLITFSIISHGCSLEDLSITDCESLGFIRPVCEMQTPEDMAALPDGKHLLLVNFGGMFSGTGYISLFNTLDESSKLLSLPTNRSNHRMRIGATTVALRQKQVSFDHTDHISTN